MFYNSASGMSMLGELNNELSIEQLSCDHIIMCY